MILVADSGSTKTDWAMLNGSSTEYTQTIGFNPMFHDTAYILDHVLENKELSKTANEFTHVFYYGASCSSEGRIKTVHDALVKAFPKAKIKVRHDISGAVLASCKEMEGIACILGTGSNCVYYNGKDIKSYTSALGYVLGDEASGAYLGKRLLADFINGAVPESISTHIKKTYKIDKEMIFEAVYHVKHANRYLAQYSKVYSKFMDDAYTIKTLTSAFNAFIQTHILAIPRAKHVPIHFVGSIALHFKPILSKCLMAHGLTLGNIIHKPIESLVQFHKHEV